MILDSDDIERQESRYRGLFINSLSGFKSANLIGSCDKQNNTNLAIFSSVFHIGAHPPLLGLIVRPHSVSRHTLENIQETGYYTINHVNKSIYQQAHQTSARYDKTTSEFEATELTQQYLQQFPAPFVEQSRIQLGMKFREQHHLSINATELIIGEIVLINIKDDVVSENGYVDIEKAGSLSVSSLNSYHLTELLSHMRYARPGGKAETDQP